MFDAFDRVGSAAESGDRLPSKTRSRSPASVLNSLVWRRGFEATESIPYGEGARRTLDIYRPNAATASPVVVFFYGGNWQSGDKEMYLFLAAALARRGYVTVVPDYRVYPGARYPQFIEDGALAVRWVRDNAARFGGDPQRLFVMGHSAGAYIAAMLAFDRRWLRAVGLSPGRDIAGLICIAGPYDFLPLEDETLKVIFGGANAPATQPISYVSGGEPRRCWRRAPTTEQSILAMQSVLRPVCARPVVMSKWRPTRAWDISGSSERLHSHCDCLRRS